MEKSAPHTLYRLYDKDGTLLYVGATFDLAVRLQKHKSQKAWWTKVSVIKLSHFRTREELMQAESAAIGNEKPLYNEQQSSSAFPAQWAHPLVARNPLLDDKNLLYTRYWVDQLNLTQLGEELGVPPAVVRLAMLRLGLKVRSRGSRPRPQTVQVQN